MPRRDLLHGYMTIVFSNLQRAEDSSAGRLPRAAQLGLVSTLVLASMGVPQAPFRWTSVDDPRHDTGQIVLELALTIGDTAGPGMLCFAPGSRGRFFPNVTRDNRGNTFVSSGCDCNIQVFGVDGQFSDAFGGPCGEGPGELSLVERIAVGGSVFVTGSPPGRIVVYSPEFQRQGQFVVPGRVNAMAALGPDTVAINVRESSGSGLYEYRKDGTKLTSFLTDPLREQGGWSVAESLALTDDSDGRLWAARTRDRYQIVAWRAGSGEPVIGLARDADWYASDAEATTNPVRMGSFGLSWFDGRLWTLHQRPEYARVVEAIDPDGMLIGQRTFAQGFDAPPDSPPVATPFMGWARTMLWRMRDTDEGNLVIELFRVELQPNGGRRIARR